MRGYAWVNARGGRARSSGSLTTHLEAFGSGIALEQAQELLAGPAGAPAATRSWSGDFNSDPLNGSVDGSGEPHWAAYRGGPRGAGFFDEWLKWAPAGGGLDLGSRRETMTTTTRRPGSTTASTSSSPDPAPGTRSRC